MRWSMLPASEFPRHADMWRRFNADTGGSALLEPEFVQALLDAFGAAGVWLAVCAADGVTLAMTLVESRRSGTWASFQPSQAPIGLWLQRADVSVEALLAALVRKLPGLPLLLSVYQCDPLLLARPPDSAVSRSLDYITTAHIDIAGSFDDYWAARGKNLRSNLKKQRNKLARDGIVARLQIERAPAQMAQAVADFGRLESAGWKQQGGTAVHPENAQGRFYRAMLEAYARRDAACVYRYWFGEQLMAMDLCIEGNGSLIVLKTTYDESAAGGLSPTLLMREECCQQLFEQSRHQRLEFYGKVMEWHTRWTDQMRTLYHLNHYRWSGLVPLHRLANRRAQRPAADTAAHTDTLSTE